MSRALLMVGGTERAPEIRHEVAVAVPDAVVWLERDGEGTLWASPFDTSPITGAGTMEDVRSIEELGFREIRRDPAIPTPLLDAELTRRALEANGVRRVEVPGGFPLIIADHLRADGVEVVVADEVFTERRRTKLAWELDGMRAAAHAAQAALLEAAAVLRGGGELTCEAVRERMVRVLLDHGAESEEVLIHAGAGLAAGHDLGFGPIPRDLPVQIDCFPRDRKTGMFIDMSRTWVVGAPSAEADRHWRECHEALELAFAGARPGVDDLYVKVADYFFERGHPSQLHPPEGQESTDRGFTPSLGHGVGLEVHEAPNLGIRPEPLADGDIVAIEPSLGYEGVGFVMLEDTVRVTPSGAEHLVEPLPYGLALPGA